MSATKLNLILEFGGGAEFLFNKCKKHDVEVDGDQVSNW
ncbi:hypothetical protein Bhyg_08370 [Pseudolycoriella hygida]|uniref:Uncharacterized protein n=1 Tax=Pseudolycoriella hygida TaxID=35572 RepID=A0A9Q0S3J6_9DIPT|nr:hypothetical protein Bhyg_08370 [Pseudolycoriella hygida]